MSPRNRPPRRRAFRLVAALVPALALATAGCKDQRGDPLGPDTGVLDGDVLFASAVVSAEMYRVFNTFAEQALDLYESGANLPVLVPGCLGTGRAAITDNMNDGDPATFGITFDNYVSDCSGFQLTWNTDPTVDGRIVITFLETSPGLVFEVLLPMVGNSPRGVSVQLPSDEGGFILATTTPVGPLLYQLDGTRAAGGQVHVDGTLRIEDRAQPLVLIEDIRLRYAFDDGVIPKFADWPSGAYEIGAFQGGAGGFGFGGSSPSFPVDVFFDGSGGVAFPVGERTCVGNLATGENPCEDL